MATNFLAELLSDNKIHIKTRQTNSTKMQLEIKTYPLPKGNSFSGKSSSKSLSKISYYWTTSL